MADKKTEKQTVKASSKGRTTLAPDVVSTIAKMAAMEVPGVRQIGEGSLIGRLMGDSSGGIDVEVGEEQAAFDLSIVIEYGTKVGEVAEAIRSLISKRVNEMLDRDVVEVNIRIIGIHLPEEAKPLPKTNEPRVR